MSRADQSQFTCIGCGASVPLGAEVCPGCGHRFASFDSWPVPDPWRYTPKPRSRPISERNYPLRMLGQILAFTVIGVLTMLALAIAFLMTCSAIIMGGGNSFSLLLVLALVATLVVLGLVIFITVRLSQPESPPHRKDDR
ncbi:hypothetical protein P12x_005081 [Tundrisphaera lichenicola]|uniref:hypothetical protein n=1 Tax=Tundrisphaera lichenicola TaxID=2029860 RepID=UPI003EC10FFF